MGASSCAWPICVVAFRAPGFRARHLVCQCFHQERKHLSLIRVVEHVHLIRRFLVLLS